MNQIVLSGRFTKEHNLESSKDGKTKILRNAIAVKRDENTTDFVPITFLGKLAESVEKYTGKGNRITIVGELHITNYEDSKTKEKKSFTSVLVNNAEFIDFKDSKENSNESTDLPY